MVPLPTTSQQPLRFRVKPEFASVYPELEPPVVYSGQGVPGHHDFIRVMLQWPHGIVSAKGGT